MNSQWEWGQWRSRLLAIALGITTLSAAPSGCGSNGPTSTPPPPPPPGTGGFEIAFSTYLGGNEFEEFREPRLLRDGRLLVGSRTLSSNMPVTSGAYQPNFGGGTGDSWIGILRADGSALDAATYFGGSGTERTPYGLEKLASGDIVFSSGTTSPNIPTTSQSFAPNLQSPTPSPGDGYVCRISGDLRSLRWCTYTTGGWPRGGVAVDAAEDVWVVGRAVSAGFVTTPDAIQRAARGVDDAFLMKLSSDGRQVRYSTRLGGNSSNVGEVALSVMLDASGGTHASGISRSADFPTTANAAQPSTSGITDGWALQLNMSNELQFTTLVGGGGDDFVEHRSVLMLDRSQLLAGVTRSTGLPGGGGGGSTNGYVALVSADGSRIDYSGPFAGSGFDALFGPEVDANGRIYLFGMTSSPNLPVTSNALQPRYGGNEDGYLVVLAPDRMTIEYATYIGGSGADMVRGVAITPTGQVFLVGRTRSDDFPLVDALQGQRGGDDDGFVMKLNPR